mmetsp:Transcript_51252/g.108934  ORF Transcript_51252/g.108934 Transcript_51252/m.108934 type:complete len:202 (-) Transcript_51252:1993-2598(-)
MAPDQWPMWAKCHLASEPQATALALQLQVQTQVQTVAVGVPAHYPLRGGALRCCLRRRASRQQSCPCPNCSEPIETPLVDQHRGVPCVPGLIFLLPCPLLSLSFFPSHDLWRLALGVSAGPPRLRHLVLPPCLVPPHHVRLPPPCVPCLAGHLPQRLPPWQHQPPRFHRHLPNRPLPSSALPPSWSAFRKRAQSHPSLQRC